MTRYQITSDAGVDLGTYVGASPREAIEAMWADAGWEVRQTDVEALRDEARRTGDASLALACNEALGGGESAWLECERVICDARAASLTVLQEGA